MSDQYTTIKLDSYGEFKDRGSKFQAYAFPVYDEEDIKSRLEEVKKLHPKARHHCFAFRTGLEGNSYRANDDGEPSGTAGRPILGQIDSFGLTNVIVIVVRYFGGTKLGTSGLINAYKVSAKAALENAQKVTKTVDNIYKIGFEYDIMPHIMKQLKDLDIEIIDQTFEDTAMLNIAVRQSEAEDLLDTIRKTGPLKIEFVKTR